jgi:hypothetical protein
VRDLGAERFISAEAGRPGEAVGGLDVVIDTVGGSVLGDQPDLPAGRGAACLLQRRTGAPSG